MDKKVKSSKSLKSRLQHLSTQLKEKSCVLYRKYREVTGRSLRLEILNLVAGVGIVAFIIGSLVSGITVNIGRYNWIDYEKSRHNVENQLADAAKRLNRLDYMTIEYNIDPETIKGFVEPNMNQELTTHEELLKDFAVYLYSNIYGKYGDERFYSDGNRLEDLDVELIDETLETLYTDLKELLEKGMWADKKVREMVQGYYETNNRQMLIKDTIIKEKLQHLEHMGHVEESKTYFLDSKGNVMYNEGLIKTIDIVQAINTTNRPSSSQALVKSIYPIILNGEPYYLYNESTLRGTTVYGYSNINKFIGFFVGILVFVFLIFKLTAAKIRYIEYLSTCLGEIAKGHLDYTVEVKGRDELGRLAKDMEHMKKQLKRQIQERMEAEQAKNELITNVAHDLRTPLTSIIGYIGLIKEGHFETSEERIRYLDIAYSKAERLKILIGDLFDYTKLTSHQVVLKKEKISAALLMNQMIEELRPQAENKKIRIVTYTKTDNSIVDVDVMKMARVFENLLENAIKYSKENDVIQVIIQNKNHGVYTSVRNRCEMIPEGNIDQLFERFYRSDLSRNSETGGSGLGLAIAKHIVTLHEGKIWAQLDGDMISFIVKLKSVKE